VAIIVPNRNVWRIERASRVAVLADAASYFQALREAFLNARRSIVVIGWDLDSRTRLVGPSGKPGDGYPADLSGFLTALAEERPELTIQLLLWDYSVLYALEREPFPMLSLQWKTATRVRFALDNSVPIGSSQHQKIVVVDDTLAFSGGMDLTIRRWDTSAHEANNPRRVDPAGKPYRPFHDVQIMVDGAAARSLMQLASMRWLAATCEELRESQLGGDPWPSCSQPDFTNIEVGIARTQPETAGPAVREVEQLFLDSIAAAEHSIYVENQFVTSLKVARALALRMRDRPQLETLIVAPRSHDSWLAESTMRNGRIRFMELLRQAGIGGRLRLAYPRIDTVQATDTMVHSKVMIVDDRLLRVGSANLNNRSMGTDAECDLVLEAVSGLHRDRIRAVRNRLLAEHCGTQTEVVDTLTARGISLIEISKTLSCRGHALCDIADGPGDISGGVAYLEGVADPEAPLEAAGFISLFIADRLRPRRLRTFAKVAGMLLAVLSLTLFWLLTPISELTDVNNIESALSAASRSPCSAFIVVCSFVAGGLIAFPVNLLIAATAAAFGPMLGLIYSTAGAMASALVTYALGSWLGRESLLGLLGPRLNRIRRGIAKRGILAIAAVRVVPIAPFTLVNVVAGASEIRLVDFLVGTALGLAPGLVLMSALGHQVMLMFTEPKTENIILFVASGALWLALIVLLQAALQRFRRADS
jgi:phospholipase D1/2